jgi:hypothetical protein
MDRGVLHGLLNGGLIPPFILSYTLDYRPFSPDPLQTDTRYYDLMTIMTQNESMYITLPNDNMSFIITKSDFFFAGQSTFPDPINSNNISLYGYMAYLEGFTLKSSPNSPNSPHYSILVFLSWKVRRSESPAT